MVDLLVSGSVQPAYGRKYKKNAEAIADFRAGKDFIHCFLEKPCSVRDFRSGSIVEIRITDYKLAVVTV